MKGIIQIAGIRDLREAEMLLAAGVHRLGFPLRLDVHREDMTAAETAAVIASLDPSAFAILISYLSRTEDLIALCRKTGCRRVQLHGEITLPQLKRLRSSQRDLFLIKSLIVRNRNLAGLKARMRSYTPYVDAFITDTFDPVTGASGATGKIHDWEISRELVEVSGRPVILAGGLNPVNVKQAILQVRPAGVDAHTGVEGPNGRKDEGRIRAFVREALDAFERIGGSNP